MCDIRRFHDHSYTSRLYRLLERNSDLFGKTLLDLQAPAEGLCNAR